MPDPQDLSAVKVLSLVKFNRLMDADMQAKITVKNMSRMIPTSSFHTPSNSKKGEFAINALLLLCPKKRRSVGRSSRANVSGAAPLNICNLMQTPFFNYMQCVSSTGPHLSCVLSIGKYSCDPAGFLFCWSSKFLSSYPISARRSY